MKLFIVAGVGVLMLVPVSTRATDVARRGAIGGAITFHGNGSKKLPPFRIHAPSTLYWTCTGTKFWVWKTYGLMMTPYGLAHRGWTYLEPDRYRLKLEATGKWTVRVVQATVKPRRTGRYLSYSGVGLLWVPPFTTSHATRLYWTNNGPGKPSIQINAYDIGHGGDVVSSARSGSTRIEPGRHVLEVRGDRWSIRWSP